MLNQLRVAQQEIYQAHNANPLTTKDSGRALTTCLFEQNEQCWTDSLDLSSLASGLQSQVSKAQSSTQEAVFARQVG